MNGLVVVIGGSGALGKAFISHFNSLNYVKMVLGGFKKL